MEIGKRRNEFRKKSNLELIIFIKNKTYNLCWDTLDIATDILEERFKPHEHYTGTEQQKNALGYIDQLIGYETASEEKRCVEILKDLRTIIELYWGK